MSTTWLDEKTGRWEPLGHIEIFEVAGGASLGTASVFLRESMNRKQREAAAARTAKQWAQDHGYGANQVDWGWWDPYRSRRRR